MEMKSSAAARTTLEALADYPRVALLWAQEALRKRDRSGLESAMEAALLGAKSDEPASGKSKSSLGFLTGQGADLVKALAGGASAEGSSECALAMSPLGGVAGSAEGAAADLLAWAANKGAGASFAACVLARLAPMGLGEQFWEKEWPLAIQAADRVRLTQPCWARQLIEVASRSGAHRLAEALGGPPLERANNLASLAGLLSGRKQKDGLEAQRLNELLAELGEEGPIKLLSDNERDPLNWGCADELAASALASFRANRLELTLKTRGQPDFLALGMALINDNQPLAFEQFLGIMKDRAMPLTGRLGKREHLARKELMWRVDAGKPRGGKPVYVAPQTLFEAALSKGSDWALRALDEAGAPAPKPAVMEKTLAEWAQRLRYPGMGSGNKPELIQRLRVEYEAILLERSARPAKNSESVSRPALRM